MEINTDFQPASQVGVPVLRPQTGWEGNLARWISRISSPPLVAGIGMLLFVLAIQSRRLVAWSLFYALVGMVLPILYILYCIRRGELTDFHMRVRAQRKRPMLFLFACSLVALIMMMLGKAPAYLAIFAAVNVAQTIFLTLVTLRWKISGHTTAAASLAVFLLGLYGATALPGLMIIPVVAWSRIQLRRHTLLQTIAGTAAGAVFMFSAIELIKFQCGGALEYCQALG